MNDPKLQEIVSRIVDAVHPTRIYLFGSRARGDASSDADCHILSPQAREGKVIYEAA